MSSQAKVHPSIQGILDVVGQAPSPAAAPVDLAREYTRLLNRLFTKAPVEGFSRASDVGSLTNLEFRAVLHKAPELLYEAAQSEVLAKLLHETLGTRPSLTADVAMAVGMALYSVLLGDVQRYLMDEVQAEVDKDEDARSGDDSDERAACEASAAARSAWS